MRLVLLAIIALSPIWARAEEAPELSRMAAPIEAPKWSFGVGIGVLILSVVGGNGFDSSLGTRGVPNTSLTVERKVRDSTTLMGGISVAIASSTARPLDMQLISHEVITQTQNILLAVGIRQQLLSEHAPV